MLYSSELIICITIICLVLIYVFKSNLKREPLTVSSNPRTIIGGIISTQMRYADGSTTMVRKLLGNSGETIILLHNSPFDQQVWYSLFTYTQLELKAGKEIPTLISYDIRGHGTAWIPVDARFNDDDPTNTAWTFDELADELYQLYKTYTPDERVKIAGYGVGSRIGGVFALKHPDAIAHLYVLQSGMGKVGDTSSEIRYFSDWINAHADISYLTIQESYVRVQMCKWFQTLDKDVCPDNSDRIETAGSTEYLLADKLWRMASAATFLQVTKMVTGINLRELWAQQEYGSIKFPVTILTADRDNYVSVADAKADLKVLKDIGVDVDLQITEGKHGYTVVHTDYISLLFGSREATTRQRRE